MKNVYGYLINLSAVYIPARKRIVSVEERSCTLRHTMSQLLLFLMQKRDSDIVTDEEILLHVWDKNDLSGTRTRLWQVMRELQRKLYLAGVKKNVFIRIKGKGYLIEPGEVKPLYI